MKIQIESNSDKFLTDKVKYKDLTLLACEGQEDEKRASAMLIQYAEQRQAFTMLVSGGATKNFFNAGYIPTENGRMVRLSAETCATDIQPLDTTMDSIDGKAVKQKVYGRIQRSVRVLGKSAYGAVGKASNDSGSFFSLVLETNEARPQMVCTFPNHNKQARIHAEPRRNPSGSGYIYDFQTYANDSFDWNSWMGNSQTIFCQFATVGERSMRGHSVMYFPDTYINHSTTIRKGFSMTGDAYVKAKKIKYSLNVNGTEIGGITTLMERTFRATFNLEIDQWAWDGQSTMRGANNELLSQPSQVDEKGDSIYQGDGVRQQIKGANDAYASTPSGKPTWADFESFIENIVNKLNPSENKDFAINVCTSAKGATHLKNENLLYLKNYTPVTFNYDLKNVPGGQDFYSTIRCDYFDVAGVRVNILIVPQFSDEQRYPARLPDGSLVMEYTYLVLDNQKVGGVNNLSMQTIRTDNVNREYVWKVTNGMTGIKDYKIESTVDEINYELLTERMVTVRNIDACGILEPSYSVVDF